MVRPWQDLQTMLQELFPDVHVYYQPSANQNMEYPAIRYSRTDIQTRHADNAIYSARNKYQITVIANRPDSQIAEKLLVQLPYCSYDRHYTANNLHHDVLTLYF